MYSTPRNNPTVRRSRVFGWWCLSSLLLLALPRQPVMAQSTTDTADNDDCYSNTTILAQDIQAADPTQGMATYVLCPDTIFEIRADVTTMMPEDDTTTENGNMMLPLLLRSNTTILCGPDGVSTNQCVLQSVAGGDGDSSLSSQQQQLLISLPQIFGDATAENVIVSGVTLQASSMGTAVLLGNAGDVSLVDCIFRNHSHGNVVNMIDWTVLPFPPTPTTTTAAPPSPPEGESPTTTPPPYDEMIDEITDIVNQFTPKRDASDQDDDNNNRNRDLSHITFQIVLPEGCTMENFEHDFASAPARLVDLVRCVDFCGPGQYVDITVTSVCTTLDEEGCVNTVDCVVAGCNEDCNAAAGECDCTDKFGQAADGSLTVTGLCEEVCTGDEPVDEVTVAPTTLAPVAAPATSSPTTSSPTSAPISSPTSTPIIVPVPVPVPETRSPTTSAPVSVTSSPTASPVVTVVPSRQKVTFERCVFTSNTITASTNTTGPQGLVVAGSALNDVMVKDCIFSDNTYETGASDSAVAIVVQDGSTLNIQGTCFDNNDFQGAGVVVAVGSANVEAINNYGTTDDGLECEFVALVASLDQPVGEASCVGYDLDECGGGDVAPESPTPATPVATPAEPMPTTTTTTASPVMSTPTVPEEDGFSCSVCEPGLILSLPNKLVAIPPGIAPEGITELACGVIDNAVRGNPDQFDESTCSQLRALYGSQCGCVPAEGQPTPAPVTRPPSSGIACTICPDGEEITLPDAVIAIPEAFFSEGRTFATCELLQTGLDDSPDLVGDDLCPSLREFYSIPCGCKPVGTDDSDTSGSTSTKRELVFWCVVVVVVGWL